MRQNEEYSVYRMIFLAIMIMVGLIVATHHRGCLWPSTPAGTTHSGMVILSHPDREFVDRVRKIHIREHIAKEVVAGTLSFAEGAEEFASTVDESETSHYSRLPGVNKKEKLYRWLIGYISTAIETTPGADTSLPKRLEEELERRIQAGEFLPDESDP